MAINRLLPKYETETHNVLCLLVAREPKPLTCIFLHAHFRCIQNMEGNWKNARHTLTRIECHSENSKGVYCLQYDDSKIISGLRDNTIKVCFQRSHCVCVSE